MVGPGSRPGEMLLCLAGAPRSVLRHMHGIDTDIDISTSRDVGSIVLSYHAHEPAINSRLREV